jgi:hypothetical protein
MRRNLFFIISQVSSAAISRRPVRRACCAAAPPERRASLQEVSPDEVADEARSPGEAQPSSERNGTREGRRCFFGGAIVHRGGPMTYSCTVRAQCARITERSGRGGFSNSFAIRKKLVDATGFEPATLCLQRLLARRINNLARVCRL